ncbi:MAG: hypothetical protein ACRDD1_11450, partial [Planctomycetia bacterium]
MNHFVYFIASGWIFFLGVGLILTACLASAVSASIRRIAKSAAVVGMVFVAASATPLPFGLYAVGFLFLMLWLFTEPSAVVVLSQRRRRFQIALRTFTVLIATASVLWELPFHFTPVLTPTSARVLAIVGDSLAAGVEDGERTWPKLLADGPAAACGVR